MPRLRTKPAVHCSYRLAHCVHADGHIYEVERRGEWRVVSDFHGSGWLLQKAARPGWWQHWAEFDTRTAALAALRKPGAVPGDALGIERRRADRRAAASSLSDTRSRRTVAPLAASARVTDPAWPGVVARGDGWRVAVDHRPRGWCYCVQTPQADGRWRGSSMKDREYLLRVHGPRFAGLVDACSDLPNDPRDAVPLLVQRREALLRIVEVRNWANDAYARVAFVSGVFRVAGHSLRPAYIVQRRRVEGGWQTLFDGLDPVRLADKMPKAKAGPGRDAERVAEWLRAAPMADAFAWAAVPELPGADGKAGRRARPAARRDPQKIAQGGQEGRSGGRGARKA